MNANCGGFSRASFPKLEPSPSRSHDRWSPRECSTNLVATHLTVLTPGIRAISCLVLQWRRAPIVPGDEDEQAESYPSQRSVSAFRRKAAISAVAIVDSFSTA